MQNPGRYDSKTNTLFCQDTWVIDNLEIIKKFLKTIPTNNSITIDGKQLSQLDIAGTWLLISFSKRFPKAHFENFTPAQQKLIGLIEKREIKSAKLPEKKELPTIQKIGKNAWRQLFELLNYLSFIGKLTVEAIRITVSNKNYRWNSIVDTIDKTGYQALFIIALLSFMIGVVITYQMGLQLRNYGANIFIVDLLGFSVLREFGPLITAIMVAGRTGSSFTAQLGIMKINQEIDALDTMGVTPGELLVIPRVIGLAIALPLLTMWADIFGILGGMMMANSMFSITWYDFLTRFGQEIPLKALLIGLGKAPIFALLISSISCYQGMQVSGSAESIGKNTTRSVVLGIFFIIITDAIFSIIFSKLKL